MKTTKLNDCFQIRYPKPTDKTGFQCVRVDLKTLTDNPDANYRLLVMGLTRREFAEGGLFRNLITLDQRVLWDLEIDIPPSKVRPEEDPEEAVAVSIHRLSGIVEATIGHNRVNFLVQDEYENLPVREERVLLAYWTPHEDGYPFPRDPNYTVAFKMSLEDNKPSVVNFHN